MTDLIRDLIHEYPWGVFFLAAMIIGGILKLFELFIRANSRHPLPPSDDDD